MKMVASELNRNDSDDIFDDKHHHSAIFHVCNALKSFMGVGILTLPYSFSRVILLVRCIAWNYGVYLCYFNGLKLYLYDYAFGR